MSVLAGALVAFSFADFKRWVSSGIVAVVFLAAILRFIAGDRLRLSERQCQTPYAWFSGGRARWAIYNGFMGSSLPLIA